MLLSRRPLSGGIAVAVCAVILSLALTVAAPGAPPSEAGAAPAGSANVRRSISELVPTAVIRLGKTADWVAVDSNSVWVGSTGPNAVHRIDPRSAKRVATVELNGEPCAGLAAGLGSVWVPLCGTPPTLAKVDANRNTVIAVFPTGPAAEEGGVTTSPDSVWLMSSREGTLVRLDPDTGAVRQTVRIAPGSYNPRYYEGMIWVTRAEAAEVTVVDASSGAVRGTVPTGPGPRFLTDGAGSVWTLNQGDGSLTRIDARSRQVTRTIGLGTPGRGGDIAFGGGMIWTTMPKVPLSAIDAVDTRLSCQWAGPGGDSLGIGHDAIWLTDYHGGTVARLDLQATIDRCKRRD